MGKFTLLEDLKNIGFKLTHTEDDVSLFHDGIYEIQVKKVNEKTKDEIIQEYEDDITKFGFDLDCYSIDFSDVSLEDTEALCRFFRARNLNTRRYIK